MDGISEETKAEIKRKYGPHDKPPKNEAERVRRERMNAGAEDTPYCSIRYVIATLAGSSA